MYVCSNENRTIALNHVLVHMHEHMLLSLALLKHSRHERMQAPKCKILEFRPQHDCARNGVHTCARIGRSHVFGVHANAQHKHEK